MNYSIYEYSVYVIQIQDYTQYKYSRTTQKEVSPDRIGGHRTQDFGQRDQVALGRRSGGALRELTSSC